MLEGEVRGLACQASLGHRDVFGERAMAETVDMIAGRERGHTTSYLLDRAGQVSPGDQESRLANAADTGRSHQHRFTANEMPVPRVRTAGPHPHQHQHLR